MTNLKSTFYEDHIKWSRIDDNSSKFSWRHITPDDYLQFKTEVKNEVRKYISFRSVIKALENGESVNVNRLGGFNTIEPIEIVYWPIDPNTDFKFQQNKQRDNLQVYSVADDDSLFHKQDITYAKEKLSSDWEYPVYYVRDNIHNTICFVNMGGHLTAVIFLLKKYYGLSDYKKEDIKKWQDIIQNNFVIYNSVFHKPEYYAEEIMDDSTVFRAQFVDEYK